MKTNTSLIARAAGAAILLSACLTSAYADEPLAANEKRTSGTVVSVDGKERVLKTQGWMLQKTFVLGENCTFVLDDKTSVGLGEFRPGQTVTVIYKDADGVLVADRIIQDRLFFNGEVKMVDPKNRTLSVQHGSEVKSFSINENCGVSLNGKPGGALEDIKPGSRVIVKYETPNGHWTARQIEQPSLHFTGMLSAINLSDRTISASKPLLGDKKFHIADGCAVVVNGKVTRHVQDLRPGEDCELSYDVVNGVNIVNRIAPVMVQQKNMTADATVSKSMPAY